MGQVYNMIGFIAIVILYTAILLMAAGAIHLARKTLVPQLEWTFFAMFLIMSAAFYLAFAAYSGVATAWRLETAVVMT